MKTILFYILLLCSLGAPIVALSQTINWGATTQQRQHLLHLHAGWDYGLNYGLAYAHRLPTPMPIFLNIAVSAPFGSTVPDDFKTKVGGQARLYQLGRLYLGASIFGIYRRFENPLVRLQNFGSEFNIEMGYYHRRWFVAGAFGFDKAIVTHYKHTQTYREFLYAGVQDGWQGPPSGGNFHYGLQTGYSFGRNDLTLSLGRVKREDWQGTPLVPFYAGVGYNVKLGNN